MTDPVQDFFDAPPVREIDALRARLHRIAVEGADPDSGSLSEDEERDRADRIR
jgi:hypothetical protein